MLVVVFQNLFSFSSASGLVRTRFAARTFYYMTFFHVSLPDVRARVSPTPLQTEANLPTAVVTAALQEVKSGDREDDGTTPARATVVKPASHKVYQATWWRQVGTPDDLGGMMFMMVDKGAVCIVSYITLVRLYHGNSVSAAHQPRDCSNSSFFPTGAIFVLHYDFCVVNPIRIRFRPWRCTSGLSSCTGESRC